MRYDDAGNLTKDSYNGYGQMKYNADNRMVEAQDSYAGTSYYTYNADGQRVRRKINNVETWAIYGLDGEMVAEYAASSATNSPQKSSNDTSLDPKMVKRDSGSAMRMR
jgi:YD repeat-containing protein